MTVVAAAATTPHCKVTVLAFVGKAVKKPSGKHCLTHD
jgi:hypothetical protein